MPAKCRHPDGSLHHLYTFNNYVICSRCNRRCPEITLVQAVSVLEDLEFEAPDDPQPAKDHRVNNFAPEGIDQKPAWFNDVAEERRPTA